MAHMWASAVDVKDETAMSAIVVIYTVLLGGVMLQCRQKNARTTSDVEKMNEWR